MTTRTDPVFEAIKRYDEAYMAFTDASASVGELENREVADSDPRMVAAVKREMRLMNASEAAKRALVNTIPTTPAGIAAVLKATRKWSDDSYYATRGFDEKMQAKFLITIERAVTRLAA